MRADARRRRRGDGGGRGRGRGRRRAPGRGAILVVAGQTAQQRVEVAAERRLRRGAARGGQPPDHTVAEDGPVLLGLLCVGAARAERGDRSAAQPPERLGVVAVRPGHMRGVPGHRQELVVHRPRQPCQPVEPGRGIRLVRREHPLDHDPTDEIQHAVAIGHPPVQRRVRDPEPRRELPHGERRDVPLQGGIGDPLPAQPGRPSGSRVPCGAVHRGSVRRKARAY